MPPRDPSRSSTPPDLVAVALEQLHKIDPNIDARPGTAVRTVIEAALRAAQPSGLPDYGTNLGSLLNLGPDYSAIERRILAGMGLTEADLRAAATPGSETSFRNVVRRGLRGQTHHVAFLDDMAFSPARVRPLTREGLRQAREQIESWGTPAPRPPIMDQATYADIVGTNSHAAMTARAREQIMAEEDRRIFEALDLAAQQPSTSQSNWAAEYMGTFAADPPYESNPPGWRMQELPGRVAVNTRAAERVMAPEFSIQSNPTVNIDEIRERRFNLTERQPPPPPNETELERMNRIALIVRRTAWQWVLAVEDDLEFPV